MGVETWTDEGAEALRQLWDAGHSSSEIGRRMGLSKNAVLGKARRLGLKPRPSPIGAAGEAKPTAKERQRIKRERRALAAAPKPQAAQPVQPARMSGRETCAYLAGDGPPWRRCDEAAVRGKPYCENHAARCYIRQDAA